MQVLLVTWGYNDYGDLIESSRDFAYSLRPIKSTEILILNQVSQDGYRFWRKIHPLPSARSGLKAAVLDNEIFVFGGYGFGEGDDIETRGNSEIYKHESTNMNTTELHPLKDILVWRTDGWEKVGEMMEARYSHAVGMLADVSEICPWLLLETVMGDLIIK